MKMEFECKICGYVGTDEIDFIRTKDHDGNTCNDCDEKIEKENKNKVFTFQGKKFKLIENNSPQEKISKHTVLDNSFSQPEDTFNLSEKIILPRTEDDFTVLSYHDVKEFIKMLKEEFDLVKKNKFLCKQELYDIVDKLAGDELK
jgi:hypothetical protein